MNVASFNSILVQKIINSYKKKLSEQYESNDFESKRNEHIQNMLSNFINEANSWDKDAPINMEYIFNKLINELEAASMETGDINIVFAYCYRFLLEYHINQPQQLAYPYSSIQSFVTHQLDAFDTPSKIQLEFAIRELPISILKKLVSGDDINNIKLLASTTIKAKEKIEAWDNELDKKEKKVNSLKIELDKHEDAYNFVGLYAGFAKLGRIKSKELYWSKAFMLALGVIIPLAIIIQAIVYA